MELSDTEIKHYYNLAIQSYNNIDPLEIEDADKSTVVLQNKSIAVIFNHSFLPVPLLEVSFNLITDGKNIGYYKIYFDKDDTCIEEVFFLYG